MEFLILLNGISFNELMEARLIVEPELAARAAERASDEQISDIKMQLDRMETSGTDQAELIHHDLLFHQAIFQAAGNRVCGQMFAVVHRSLERLMGLTAQIVDASHTVGLHRRIHRAIARREPEEARHRMLEHLLDARDLLKRAVDRAGQSQLQSRIALLSPQGSKMVRPAVRKRMRKNA
jgi:GntR family transcriptional repressor for pyruvate dehydrogenase complex